MVDRLLGGRYHIVKTLGSGGFCQTYIAKDTFQFNAKCVVKQLKPLTYLPGTLEVAKRLFEREAQTQHRLGCHDQIPQLLAYFQENQEFYLVQELIEGHDLSKELVLGRQLSESDVIDLLQNILEPLAFVHQQKIIHRDIKPPNLIRRKQDNKIVLIDFGAVKELGATQVINAEGKTNIVTTIGTAGYMPSEQSTGRAWFSSDVYAVGMIGIQALTGVKPENLEEDPETAEIIWRDQVQVSPGIAEVLERMVRYDFRQRYRSAEETLQALQQLNNRQSKLQKIFDLGKGKSFSPVSSPTSTKVLPSVTSSKATSRKFPLPIGISLAAIVSGVGGWYIYWQLPENRTLKAIQDSKNERNYQQCISLTKAVPPNSLISSLAQTFQKDCQNLQAESYLTKAKQLAEAKKYDQAVVELSRIPLNTSFYSEAQKLMEQWNPANYEFYDDYERAKLSIDNIEYQQAFDWLYLAAEKAIVSGQANLLSAELEKDEKGVFKQIAHQTREWQFLKEALIRANPKDYELTYENAKLKPDLGVHHIPEFELLFAAARKAIDNQQSEAMLTRLEQDRLGRFKRLAIGHQEWEKLLKALKQKNKQLLNN